MKLMWCHGFPEIYAQLEEGGGINLTWVYVLYILFGIIVFQRSLLDCGGVDLPADLSSLV